MNVAVRDPNAAQRLMIVDCDIHPTYRTPAELNPFLPQRWREHLATWGPFMRQGLMGQLPFPRMMAGGMRVDSFPEDGAPPGADLDLMRRQHLDPNGVEVGLLIALSRGAVERDQRLAARALGAAGAAAARRHRGAAGASRARGGRDRAAR